jgi:hypothetical protein
LVEAPLLQQLYGREGQVARWLSVDKDEPRWIDRSLRSWPVATVLFLGASVSQLAAIRQARAAGHRVVAVDADPNAVALKSVDAAHAVDSTNLEPVLEVGRREQIDAVVAISTDRAVPIAASVPETPGLPGIGTETARLMTDKALANEPAAITSAANTARTAGPRLLATERAGNDGAPRDGDEQAVSTRSADQSSEKSPIRIRKHGAAVRLAIRDQRLEDEVFAGRDRWLDSDQGRAGEEGAARASRDAGCARRAAST